MGGGGILQYPDARTLKQLAVQCPHSLCEASLEAPPYLLLVPVLQRQGGFLFDVGLRIDEFFGPRLMRSMPTLCTMYPWNFEQAPVCLEMRYHLPKPCCNALPGLECKQLILQSHYRSDNAYGTRNVEVTH